MSPKELGFKRRHRLIFTSPILIFLVLYDGSLWGILSDVRTAPPSVIGFTVACFAYSIYVVLLSFPSKALAFSPDAPAERLDVIRKYPRIRKLTFILSLIGFVILLSGILSNDVFYITTGSRLLWLFLAAFIMLVYAVNAFVIVESAGGIRPEKDLVNKMVYKLPFLVFFLAIRLFSFVPLQMIDPRFTLGVYIAVGVLLYFLYIEIPFMRGRARWKKRELGRLYRERKELEKRMTKTAARGATNRKLVAGKLLEEIRVQLQLIRNDMLVDEVNRSSNHPYSAAIAFAGIAINVVLFLVIEWLLSLF